MKATIFDIDGTLLQSDANDDALFLESVRNVLGDVSFRPSWGMYSQSTAAVILAEILNDNTIDATSDRVAAVRDRLVESIRRHVSEQVRSRRYRARGHLCSVCTIRPHIELPTRRAVGSDR